jgi:hypothetical protein
MFSVRSHIVSATITLQDLIATTTTGPCARRLNEGRLNEDLGRAARSFRLMTD